MNLDQERESGNLYVHAIQVHVTNFENKTDTCQSGIGFRRCENIRGKQL